MAWKVETDLFTPDGDAFRITHSLICCPSRNIRPDVGWSKAARIDSMVVLPEPLGADQCYKIRPV